MVSESKSPRLLVTLDGQLLGMRRGVSRLLLDPTDDSLYAKTTFLEVLLKEGESAILERRLHQDYGVRVEVASITSHPGWSASRNAQGGVQAPPRSYRRLTLSEDYLS